MSTTVKSLKVTYNPVNEKNTFVKGDLVTGQVTLEVAKECQIDSLFIKFKGKAEVVWKERYGQTTVVYHSKDKYFSRKQFFIRGKGVKANDYGTLLTNQDGETYSSVVATGCHVYPFTFKIPDLDMPSSFNGSVGKIVYLLEAKLSRSMRISKTDSTKINFVAIADFSADPGLMTPQHESKDKKLRFFNSGTVAMDVDIEKTGFFQGEGLKVLAHIQNNSTREIKPKYIMYQKHSFFASGKRRVNTRFLFQEVGDPIPPAASEKVTRVITIPHDFEPSILNCNIISTEYRLKVYLDVKYASDPEIKFPIVILPVTEVPAVAPPPAAAGFYSGFPSATFGTPDPAAWGVAPPQPPTAPQAFEPPPACGADGMSDFGSKY